MLDAWANEFPGLLTVESIGQSYEGREIQLATVTNLGTGPPEEKPAIFVHAQIHAMEFTGTTAALNLLDRLLHGHGDDERVTHGARHTHLLRRPSREPGRRGCGTRGWALPTFQRSAVPARGAAGRAPSRGRRRRRAPTDDAAPRPERLLEAASRRRAAARRAPARRLRRRLLPGVPRGHDPELGRGQREDRSGARGPRSEPQLARRLGARRRAARRGALSHVGARGPRARRGDRRSEEHHELHRLPHLLGRASPPVLAPVRTTTSRRPTCARSS